MKKIILIISFIFFSQQAFAGIAWVQTTPEGQTLNSGSNATVTFGTNPIAGNFIVLVVALYDNGGGSLAETITDNQSGNVYTNVVSKVSGNGKDKVFIYYCKNINSSGTFTITIDPTGASNMYITAFAMEYSGVDKVAPSDGITNSGQATSMAVSSGAIFDNSGCLYVGVMSQANSTTTIAPAGGSWNQRGEDEGASGNPINIEDLIGTGSQTATWTLGVSKDWCAVVQSFKPQAATIANVSTIAKVSTIQL